jgi:hypothetical protein
MTCLFCEEDAEPYNIFPNVKRRDTSKPWCNPPVCQKCRPHKAGLIFKRVKFMAWARANGWHRDHFGRLRRQNSLDWEKSDNL